jgi:LysR family transcriptional regulator, low CO2-responsive transcriptional regulator
MRNITLRQLRVFVEVARRLSFVRAAEALHLTPPAVTMQIKELEGAVGCRCSTARAAGLADHRRRVPAGLRQAHAGDDEGRRGRDGALSSRVETGLLNIGLVSTAKYFVPRLLARFSEEHPGIDVRLQVGATANS